MGPPGAALLVVLAHLHAMFVTPAFGLCLLALGLILGGEAVQQRFEPGQQALFVTVAQRDLHLTASQDDIDIGAGRCLWQCRDWLTLGLSLGWLCRWLSGAIAGIVKLCQLGLGQR